MSELLLNVENVTKTFPGVVALDNVSLKVNKGEIHGLIGENGAGKSTIIKILAGIYRPDSGKLSFDGEEYAGDTISGSIGRGISVIYQELCLEPYMTVYENIVLGLEEYRHGFYSAYESKKKGCENIGGAWPGAAIGHHAVQAGHRDAADGRNSKGSFKKRKAYNTGRTYELHFHKRD